MKSHLIYCERYFCSLSLSTGTFLLKGLTRQKTRMDPFRSCVRLLRRRYQGFGVAISTLKTTRVFKGQVKGHSSYSAISDHEIKVFKLYFSFYICNPQKLKGWPSAESALGGGRLLTCADRKLGVAPNCSLLWLGSFDFTPAPNCSLPSTS